MPIQFNCPHCNRPYSIAESHAGKKFACKQCSQIIKVPGAGDDAPVIAAPNTVRIAAAPPRSAQSAKREAAPAPAPGAKPQAQAGKPAPSAQPKSAPAAKPGTGKLPKLPSKLKPMGQVKLPAKGKPKAE